ncbi:MAG: GtrA family protein [Methylococcaceae bacterium]|nr:GtrA family protein [Methylococcaceae bacterium]
MPQFLKFLVSGGVAAFLNWSSRFLFSKWLSFELSITCAFFVGLTSGFLLMRFYVFNARGKPLIFQASKYVFINILALMQTLIISVVLARFVLLQWGVIENVEALAHLVGVLTPVITSYFGHKFLTFR